MCDNDNVQCIQTVEENYPIIGNDLFNMFLAVAIVTTVLLVLIVIGEWIILIIISTSIMVTMR